ncbi:MAG: thioredoxin domain-containing protein [Anaerolineae bacterium]|nr:thioredoxin domain-containing protein [Anaerolineae bacterium]
MTKKNTQPAQKATAGQRKAAARAERARRKRQQNLFFIAVIIVVVAVVIILLAWSNRPVAIAEIPLTTGQYAGLPASPTETGLYRLGSPDAPVTMEVFSSYTCTHCASLHAETLPRLMNYVKDGTLSIVLYPLANSEKASWGTRAAVCAGQQDPVKFWEMSDIGYAWIGDAYGQRHLETAAGELGLDVGALSSCMTSDATTAILQGIHDESNARAVYGTPALFFNGERPTGCNDSEGKCEGNLPYELIVQNIEAQLAKVGE